MKWERIVIHHTATRRDNYYGPTDYYEDILFLHTSPPPVGRGWSDVGYHFLISSPRLSIESPDPWLSLSARPLYRTGSHVGGHNAGSIGVAIVGTYTELEPPIGAYNVTAELCAGLCRSLDIRTDHIYPHSHFKNTICPGMTDIEKIRGMVAQLRTGRFVRAVDLPT